MMDHVFPASCFAVTWHQMRRRPASCFGKMSQPNPACSELKWFRSNRGAGRPLSHAMTRQRSAIGGVTYSGERAPAAAQMTNRREHSSDIITRGPAVSELCIPLLGPRQLCTGLAWPLLHLLLIHATSLGCHRKIHILTCNYPRCNVIA